jgi:APA family basic amino acid/polyamine antiporter
VVAYCNATSSARLAARYPSSGGTYVYGRERLGAFWGYLAGWCFVVGKTASCAAMALTVGAYVWPAHGRPVAVAAVAVLTAVNYAGLRKSAWLTRIIVAVVVAVLAALVVVCWTSGSARLANVDPFAGGTSPGGVLQAAGLLFFAFAGYARIATLGEEVRDPARTIRRAIPVALGLTLAVYAAVALAVLAVLGPARLAGATAPLAEAVRGEGPGWEPILRVAAAVAALGSLLSLLLGVSRTGLAMARDRYLPGALAAVDPGAQVPRRAVLAVGAVATVVAATVDLRAVIGFSSFGVLLYYGIANVSAWTLPAGEGRPPRAVPVVGVIGCLVMAFALPLASVAAGAGVVLVGVAVYWLQRFVRRRRTAPAATGGDEG